MEAQIEECKEDRDSERHNNGFLELLERGRDESGTIKVETIPTILGRKDKGIGCSSPCQHGCQPQLYCRERSQETLSLYYEGRRIHKGGELEGPTYLRNRKGSEDRDR